MDSTFLCRFKFFSLVFVLTNLLFAATAHASALGELALHFSSSRTEDAGAGASSTRTYRANIAMGWLSELNSDEVETAKQNLGYGIVLRSERGFQSSSSIAGYGLGVFVGYYAGPISVRLDYFALAEQQANNGQVETAYREGSGYAINVRWLHWFEAVNGGKNRMGIGPSLVFEQIGFAKSRVGSLPETSNTRSTDSLSPGIVGLFYF
jgi:hypothetical protein